jgi:hypothetical protein
MSFTSINIARYNITSDYDSCFRGLLQLLDILTIAKKWHYLSLSSLIPRDTWQTGGKKQWLFNCA